MNALILVDVQNDFLPGGALPVPEGEAVIPVANRAWHSGAFEIIVATQDWHPRNHRCFAANHRGRKVGDEIRLAGLPQVLCPVHCVQHTPGAEFAPGLSLDRAHVIQKGTDPQIDSYSGFFDNDHRKSTGLADFLREHGTPHVFILGLATDYGVKFTALDARQLGFEATVLFDGCRPVNLHPGDEDRAIEAMRAAGVDILRTLGAVDWPAHAHSL